MGGLGFAMIGSKASFALAASIAFVGSLRFLKWLIPFMFERFDVARGNLGKRLKHVELELEATRKALFLLLNRMAAKYPADPALLEVGDLLSKAWPVEARGDDPDRDLIDKIDRKGSSNAATI